MDEQSEVLRVYCDKQKVMIADLVAKVLMLETKLEILEAQRKTDIDEIVKSKREDNINNKIKNPSAKAEERGGQLR